MTGQYKDVDVPYGCPMMLGQECFSLKARVLLANGGREREKVMASYVVKVN